MGLAPYGAPEQLPALRKIVRVQKDGTFELDLRYFRHHREDVGYTWRDCAPTVGRLFTTELESLLGPRREPDEPLESRHRDLACSVQAMYEEALFAMLARLHKRYRCERLALAGGCGSNSVANGKVTLQTGFREIYVPAAAGDAGGAMGAALVVWNKYQQKQNGQTTSVPANRAEGGKSRRFEMRDAYMGPGFQDEAIKTVLTEAGLVPSNGYAASEHHANGSAKTGQQTGSQISSTFYENPDQLCSVVASELAKGQVVGWFQARMEWGPRALGNRSILGDPRRADMKDILNLKIKRRESFRPFAPSILREHVGHWFEQDANVPFMTQVFQVRPEKRGLVPAITHVDGSGRLQTVSQDANSLYWLLISKFESLTGVPMVLNTSFNENEPVVCHPREALECFLRTKMDLLVMGGFVLRRT